MHILVGIWAFLISMYIGCTLTRVFGKRYLSAAELREEKGFDFFAGLMLSLFGVATGMALYEYQCLSWLIPIMIALYLAVALFAYLLSLLPRAVTWLIKKAAACFNRFLDIFVPQDQDPAPPAAETQPER